MPAWFIMDNGSKEGMIDMKSKVKEINELLRNLGNVAIQTSNIPGRGQVVGYKPQYVLDAINAILGQDGWRWEIQEKEIYLPNKEGKGGNVYVCLVLYVKIGDEWLRKGEHFGGAKITLGNVGDALKAATTDALQKAFSTMSVARDSYSGILKKNKDRQAWERNKDPKKVDNSPQPSDPPKLQPVPNAQEQNGFEALLADNKNNVESKQEKKQPEEDEVVNPTDYGLQTVKDIKFIKKVNLIIAKDIKSGASYFSRDILGKMGFSFIGESRCWGKAI